MNKKGVGFGVFLLGVGVIWLLSNLGMVNLNIFSALFKLWPLIFVVIGINLIFKENSFIKGLTWLAFLVILILYGTFGNVQSPHFNGDWTFGTNDNTTAQHVDEPMKTGLKNGVLKLDSGAVNLDVQEENDKLIVVDSEGKEIGCNIDYNNSGDKATINLNNKLSNVIGQSKNKLDVKLNNQVLWDIKMDSGASNGDIDLSKLKVNSLEIDAGAVNYNIKLAGNVPSTDITLDSGASKYQFDIPKDVGVRVKLDGVAKNTNFNELGWTKNGSTYESPNYNNAKSKINMNADLGAAKLNINYN